MSDNLIELLKIAADMPLSRIQDDEECADSLTVLCGRAAEALASLQQRNLLFMREREGAREDAAKYQRLAAELSDKLNGTPCAEIRWMQDMDDLRAELAAEQKMKALSDAVVEELRADVERLDRLVNTLAEKNGEMVTELAAEREGRQDAIRQIAKARDERDALRTELAAVRAEGDRLIACAKLAEKERDEARADCAKLETAHGQNMRDIDKLRAELAAEREKTCVSVTVGGGLEVYGTMEAIRRVQQYILLDSTHPVESSDVRRSLAKALQAAEAERDEARAELAARDELLQRARQWLPLKEGIDAELDELIASIDAALGGGDE